MAYAAKKKKPYEVKFLPVIITSTTQYFVIVLPWIYLVGVL